MTTAVPTEKTVHAYSGAAEVASSRPPVHLFDPSTLLPQHLPLLSFGLEDAAVAGLFAVVLWFGVLNDALFPRASRPSDLVAPWLGQHLLGMEGEAWLDDFATGSRGAFPPQVLALALLLFYGGGVVLEQAVKLLYGGGDGDAALTFAGQLAVIGCIWAGVYEVGRVETGDALRSRAEDDERRRVFGEFDAFAERFLEPCSGSDRATTTVATTNATTIIAAANTAATHGSTVLKLFRRTHARHRRLDQAGAAPDTLLREALTEWWRRKQQQNPDGIRSSFRGRRVRGPTAAGYFVGLCIKQDEAAPFLRL